MVGNTKETQVVHPVKTLQKLKGYILSKRLQNSSSTSLGLSCENTKETQGVHPVKTLSGSFYENTKETQVVHPVKTLRKLKWLILSKH